MIENGIILVDKPTGMTSFGVVARVRRQLTEQKRALHEKRGFCTLMQHKEDASSAEKRTNGYAERATQQSDEVMRDEPAKRANLVRRDDWRCKCRVKVGHTGTLDPFATGLMILVVGAECKNASQYSKLDKTYEATIVLGKTSSTGDPEGEITSVFNKKVAQADIEKILPQFTGEITQIPPAFSAIKINGQRAYKLAREGKKVDIPARKITIYSCELIDYKYPNLKIRTHVSSGTYIRTLAQDIGKELGVGAYCSQLKRTTIGHNTIQKAVKLDDYGII